jgi:hypothetical protein
MHSTHLRDLFHLCRAKVIVPLLLIGFVYDASAQGIGYRRKHLEHYDDKPIHYGILFGAPFTHFKVRHNNDYLTKDTAFVIQSPIQATFRFGFVINAYLNERFDLRTTPSVSLYDRQVKYDYPGGVTKSEKRESSWIEIPLLLKYKSERRGNSRMYMVGGISLGIETNVKRSRGASASGRLDTKTSDLAIEYGIGYEQFFEYFKFAPELRFSHGIGNIFVPNKNSLGTGINRLSTHTVTLMLNFE